MNLAFFTSSHQSILEYPMLTALLVLVLCVLLWLKGGAMWRAIVLALIVSGICVSSFKWGPLLGGPEDSICRPRFAAPTVSLHGAKRTLA